MKLGEEEKVKREAAEVRERASKSRGLVGGADCRATATATRAGAELGAQSSALFQLVNFSSI